MKNQRNPPNAVPRFALERNTLIQKQNMITDNENSARKTKITLGEDWPTIPSFEVSFTKNNALVKVAMLRSNMKYLINSANQSCQPGTPIIFKDSCEIKKYVRHYKTVLKWHAREERYVHACLKKKQEKQMAHHNTNLGVANTSRMCSTAWCS